MSTDFLLTQNGDIDLTNNTATLTDNVETLSRQQVQITLRTYRGEWLWNVNFGIPYLANDNNPTQLLGAGGNNKTLLDLAIKEAILARENITDIISYESVLDTSSRGVTVSFQARTNTGEIITAINEEIA